MSDNKKDTSFWGYLGKAGVLIGVVWGALQIYNNLFKAADYDAEAKGNHSFYATSPVHDEAYRKSAEYKAVVKTIIQRDGQLKDYNLDTILKRIKANANSSERIYFNANLSEEGITPYSKNEYSSLKNIGNKPLEELALELPFQGVYKITLPHNVVKDGKFTNKIEVGELRPSYEINISCWTDNYEMHSELDEEKSRFTHKNGWFGISYPVEVTGIYAWNKKWDDMPLLIGIALLAFLVLMTFAIGEASGKEKAKQKIEEESNSGNGIKLEKPNENTQN